MSARPEWWPTSRHRARTDLESTRAPARASEPAARRADAKRRAESAPVSAAYCTSAAALLARVVVGLRTDGIYHALFLAPAVRWLALPTLPRPSPSTDAARMLSKALLSSLATFACFFIAGEAGAQPADVAPPPVLAVMRPAGEVNLAWPFLGISELKILVPLVGGPSLRGELLAGTYADYAQAIGGRPNDPGKVWILAPLVGYRQFIAYGIHVEVAAIVGLRHEDNYEGQAGVTLNDFYVRALPMVGWQGELSERFYVNARVGAGILIYRQTHEDQETKVLPTADLNFGVRF